MKIKETEDGRKIISRGRGRKPNIPKVVIPEVSEETPVEAPITAGSKEPDFTPPPQQNTFNPFKEPPTIRNSGLNAGIVPDNTQPSIQEPSIPEPDFTQTAEPITEVDMLPDTTEPGSTEPQLVNPDLGGLSQAEQRKAAEATADVLINLYGNATKKIGMAFAKPPKKKIDKMVRDKELDPEIQIATMDGTNTFSVWVNTIEQKVETAFEQSEEFVTNVKPPLTEVLMKKGVGLTPEQQIMYYVGLDLYNKGAAVVQIRGMMSQLIDYTKEMSIQLKENSQEKDRQHLEDLAQIAELKRKLNNQDPDAIQEPEVITIKHRDEGDL